ncbi:kinase-like protein, partial [Ceratobasidium sp. AG-I]
PVAGGGFSDVYRGKLLDGTTIAIKCLRLYDQSTDKSHKNPKHTARELYAWSRFKHKNVVPLLGLAMFNNQLAMISPWMSNGNVMAYLDNHPESDRCILSQQVTEGLVYLHSLGSVRGSIRLLFEPLNVLIDRNGVAKLTDFGNVIMTTYSLQFTVTKTRASHSLRWTAPELFDGADCSMQADIYALGMVSARLIITGKLPFDGKHENAVLGAVMVRNEVPLRPALIPVNSLHGDTLWELLVRCWGAKPELRP